MNFLFKTIRHTIQEQDLTNALLNFKEFYKNNHRQIVFYNIQFGTLSNKSFLYYPKQMIRGYVFFTFFVCIA